MIDDHQLAALCYESAFDVFRAEPAEPIAVLDHDPRHGRIAQQRREFAAVPVKRRPDLGHHPIDRDLFGYGPGGDTRDLPIQISFLIRRGHPRIHRGSAPQTGRPGGLVNQNQPPNLTGGHRQQPTAKPAIRSHPRNAVALSPRREIHDFVPTTHHRQLPTTHTATVGKPLAGANRGMDCLIMWRFRRRV